MLILTYSYRVCNSVLNFIQNHLFSTFYIFSTCAILKHYVIYVITQLYIGLILRFESISRLSPNSFELELGHRRLKQDGFTLISVTDGRFEDNQTS